MRRALRRLREVIRTAGWWSTSTATRARCGIRRLYGDAGAKAHNRPVRCCSRTVKAEVHRLGSFRPNRCQSPTVIATEITPASIVNATVAWGYMPSDYQTHYPDPSWLLTKLSEVQSAWYERAITIPPNWAGRRGSGSRPPP